MPVTQTLEYFYKITSGKSPKEAFVNLIEILELWDEYGDPLWETKPARYTIVNDPKIPISLNEGFQIVESGDHVKIRPSYCGCVFLLNNQYLFFMKATENV